MFYVPHNVEPVLLHQLIVLHAQTKPDHLLNVLALPENGIMLERYAKLVI